MSDRSTHPIARLWWWLLPATGFFRWPDETPLRERLRWLVPYLLWRVVNWIPVDPFKPMPEIVCTCDECTAARETVTA